MDATQTSAQALLSSDIWRRRLRLFVVVFLLVGLAQVVAHTPDIWDEYQVMRDGKVAGDFPMFFAGAQNVTSAERSQTYEPEFLSESIVALGGLSHEQVRDHPDLQWATYYNPPFYLALLAPLTLLDMHEAYAVVVGLNICALGVLAWLLVKLAGRTLGLPLSVLLLGFSPVYPTLANAQPTLLLACAFCGALLLSEGGRRWPSAALLVLLGAKPHWLTLPALVALRNDRRMLLPLLVLGTAVLVVPFALVGVDGTLDYPQLVLGRGSGDIDDATYSARLLSWSGFFRAMTGGPQPLLAMAFVPLTLAAFVVVWREGDSRLTWAAAALTALIAVPHSHIHDWMILAPAAALILSRSHSTRQLGLSAVFLGLVYLGVNSWAVTADLVVGGERGFYAVTPATLLAIGWCAVLARQTREGAAGAPTPAVHHGSVLSLEV